MKQKIFLGISLVFRIVCIALGSIGTEGIKYG